jgi:cytochrome P450
MENTLFLQSEVENPYTIYMRMLAGAPVYFDTKNNIAAIYRYALCKQILGSPQSIIPQANGENGLNESALLIKKHLVRLANPPAHADARKAAMEVFTSMQPVDIAEILDHLIGKPGEMEWVNSVCKKLPTLYLLKSFAFSEDACRYFLQHTGSLTKIMLPQRTVEQEYAINNIAPEAYERIAEQLFTSRVFRSLQHLRQNDNLLPWYVSNLAGLLIQGYDAVRGLLSNALLQVFCNRKSIDMKNRQCLVEAVTESLRFDPPVHNTRRVLLEDVCLQGHWLKKGQSILLVLAAANRDPEIFHQPDKWNIVRQNNAAHLGFGTGAHACLANSWAVNMTAETLFYLFNKYPKIEVAEEQIRYEPIVNLRMPCSIRLSGLL